MIPQIRDRSNTYKFADHKERVIDLLRRVTTISVETVKLRAELDKMPWGKQSSWRFEDSKKPGAAKKKASEKTKKKIKKPKSASMQGMLDGVVQKRLL